MFLKNTDEWQTVKTLMKLVLLGAFWAGSALFAKAYLPEYFG